MSGANGWYRIRDNAIVVSAVSFWEISLKSSLGKLELDGITPEDLPEIVQSEQWQLLPLDASTASGYASLPRQEGHKDPFDRMLIHTAIRNDFYFVSKDAAASGYARHGLKVCWWGF